MDDFDKWLRRDDVWFKAAVGTAIIVFFAVLAGALVSLFGSAGDERARNIDIVYKLGLIGAGLITFCTVAWRGLLATQQVDAQRQQIEKLAAQISATEENNLARLLQKGAELIGESENGAHVAAGIATLQAVATASNGKFATEAMDLLVDYLEANYVFGMRDKLQNAAFAALKAGARSERSASRSVKFNAVEGIETKTPFWRVIRGVRSADYKGGLVFFEKGLHNEKTRYSFVDATFDRCEVIPSKNSYFLRCDFYKCEIKSTNSRFMSNNTFRDCDFSGALINDAEKFRPLSETGNYYFVDTPPQGGDQVVWSNLLIARPREEQPDS